MEKWSKRRLFTACVCSVAILVAACNQSLDCVVPNIGGADIGGDFSLINGAGKAVTRQDVITKPSLVYFGYTYCPDFCPVDVANMARANDLIKENNSNHDVGLVFITIDPARDTPQIISEYIKNFSDDMVGLTGSDENIEAAAKAYKVYYAKNNDPSYSEYLMAHSTFTYLVDAAGEYLMHFSHNTPPETIAQQTACILSNT